ncbi:hypothetical protein [Secundilactobacillus collinoides]|uniref:hypothetical protein n=1 Tax=Secundilactobacillus collinoides TaxID=33960 RepID=UPI00158502A7|nr:hypothetical protein [Secundilactobacillus collinoides]
MKASQKSRANWLHYLDARAAERPDGLLTAEGVLKAVGTLADADTIYGLDIGNNTVWSTRMLPFDQNQKNDDVRLVWCDGLRRFSGDCC